MGAVVMHNVVSVDGFIADSEDQVGPLFDWYSNGDAEIGVNDKVSVSEVSAEYVRPMWAGIGAMVIGRHLFDITDGWEGSPPAGEHVVVVSHRPRPEGWHPEASYYFVDDVARAVAKARELAGTAPSPWPPARWAGRHSPWVRWTRWPWTWCPSSSAPANGTSAPSTPSISSRTPTW